MNVSQGRVDPIIAFRDVEVALGGDRIYERLSFEVRRGEFVCILGPSGCGKSTSLRVIGGLLDIKQGEVTVDGRTPQQAWSSLPSSSSRRASCRGATPSITFCSAPICASAAATRAARQAARRNC